MSSSTPFHDHLQIAPHAIANLLASLDLPISSSNSSPPSISLSLPPASLNHHPINNDLSHPPWLNPSLLVSNPLQLSNPTHALAQPTRSGRIPQRPDPNNQSLNPLDFIDFPTDSESDDPDFQPPQELLASSSASYSAKPKSTGSEARSSSHLLPARSSPPDGPSAQLSTDALSSTRQPLSPRPHPKPASLDQIEFDFSTLSDHQPWSGLSPLAPSPGRRHTLQAPVSGSSMTLVSTAEQPVDKPSPLTEASLAGVPFVNIPLPDSDDSPEFLPPPPKRSKRDPTRHEPSATRTDAALPPARPSKSHSQSGAPARSPLRLSHALSSRYVAIAPSPNYSSAIDGGSGQAHSPGSNAGSDHGSSVCGKPKIAFKTDGPPRAKPGPKPKPKRDMDYYEKEAFMRKKREGMRAVRERKKEYVEELEDRCLALAEENARLREENEQLLRESRENWRARALGYTHAGGSLTSGGGGMQKENSTAGAARRTVLKSGALASRGRTVLDVIARQGRNGSTSSSSRKP